MLSECSLNVLQIFFKYSLNVPKFCPTNRIIPQVSPMFKKNKHVFRFYVFHKNPKSLIALYKKLDCSICLICFQFVCTQFKNDTKITDEMFRSGRTDAGLNDRSITASSNEYRRITRPIIPLGCQHETHPAIDTIIPLYILLFHDY